MLLLLSTLAFAADVPGPWTKGSYVDFVQIEKDQYEVWLEGNTLYFAESTGLSSPHTPLAIAQNVEAGDGGQIRPEIVAGTDALYILYSTTTALVVARMASTVGPWATTTVSPPGAKGPFLATIAPKKGGGVVVAGLASNGKASEVFVDGKVVFSGGADGVCMCCKPALFARKEGLVLAFRDADGKRRDIRTLTSPDGITWTDAGEATHGAWSPGGCPADGPALTDTTLVVSDARDGKRKIYEVDRFGEHALPAADGTAEMLQPRALPDASLNVWVEATAGKSNLVVRDGPGAPTVIATTNGRMEPGDPVVVGSEVWIPWQGDLAHVVRWESQAPPGI